jgi:DNA-binding HxlR family transcriptional regulator
MEYCFHMETNGVDLAARLTAVCPRGCGVERTLKVLDGKWTTLIIRELLSGPKRFGQLRSALGAPSAKTLTDRLRALENQKILTRTVHAEVPPRVVYELTEQGHSLSGILYAMLVWGEEHPLTEGS